MREHKNFWDRNAGLYDCFMRKDRAVYEKIYELIRPVVKDKTVLELATGTGLIAKHIVKVTAHIEATDASPEMIAEAKRGHCSAKLHFSVQDMFSLPYAGNSFDVVIVSNALHIVPQPEKSLREIKRVLKDDGVLIAPTFTHAENSLRGRIKAYFMRLAGFPLHSRWTSEEYLSFLRLRRGEHQNAIKTVPQRQGAGHRLLGCQRRKSAKGQCKCHCGRTVHRATGKCGRAAV